MNRKQLFGKHWKAILGALVGLALAAVLIVWLLFWRIAGLLMERQSRAADVVVTPVADQLYMIDTKLGERQIGASHLAFVGPDGVLLVDAPMTKTLNDKVMTVLEELVPDGFEPALTVVNTHAHPDHARGNVFLEAGAKIVAHERTRHRLAQKVRPFGLLPAVPPMATEFLPAKTFETSDELLINGELITVWHPASGHTDGDVVVIFERSNVAHLGDLFHGVGGHPGVDWKSSGGDPVGMVRSLDLLLERLPDGVRIVGGHGGVGQVWTKGDLETYRDLVAETTERVRRQISEGRSQTEVVEAGVGSRWRAWFEGRRQDSVMHGPPDGWLENLYQAMTSRD